MAKFWWLFAAFVLFNVLYSWWRSSRQGPGAPGPNMLSNIFTRLFPGLFPDISALRTKLDSSRERLSQQDFEELGRLLTTIERHGQSAGLTCFEVVAIGLCSLAFLLGRGVRGIVLVGLIALSTITVGIAIFYRWHASRDQKAFIKIFEARLQEALEP